MDTSKSPYSFITPTAFRTLPNDLFLTVETIAHVSELRHTGWGDPQIGSCVRYLYDNLTPEEVIGLLQVIAEKPEEHVVAVYKQACVRKRTWVQKWLAEEEE